MNIWNVIRKSLLHYWQIHLAMILAVTVTTAVLTGALTVGDSMRGSLRDLTLGRLGSIDHVILSRSFFDGQIVRDWQKQPAFSSAFTQAIPSLHFPSATLEFSQSAGSPNPGAVPEAENWTSVGLWGVSPELAARDWAAPDANTPASASVLAEIGNGEVVLNTTAANRLGLSANDVGRLFSLRLGKPSDVPTESFIASKDDAVTSLPRLTLKAIVPDAGLGRLSLTPSTEVPPLAFLNLSTLRRAIPDASIQAREGGELFNAILLFASAPDSPVDPGLAQAAIAGFSPQAIDAGLRIDRVTRMFPTADQGHTVFDYYSISSNRMLIDFGQQSAVESALQNVPHQTTFTYLANRMALDQADVPASQAIPFSMVTALDFSDAFPLLDVQGQVIPPLQDDQIVLNQWAAEDLQVEVGQTIVVKYYEPETVDGDEVERSTRFTLAAIARLTAPVESYRNRGRQVIEAKFDQPPTTANDPWLTPEVPGVTDAASIDDWNLPFPTAEALRSQDDDYWENYRTTPKAFISAAAGQALWRSRFGRLTSYRIPADTIDETALRQKVHKAVGQHLEQVGFQIIAAKGQGLVGAQGSTPFDVLFLMFSMFVIAASLLLLALFFRLGMQQRSRELGLWLALGFNETSARRVWLQESLASSLVGIGVGLGAGIGYAAIITYLMRTAWVGAVASPFLHLHWSWLTLGLGAVGSFAVCLFVIWFSVRQAARLPTRTLLSGAWNDSQTVGTAERWWHRRWLRIGLLVAAIALSIGGFFAVGDAQAVVFLFGGFCALIAVLTTIYDRLIHRPDHGVLSWKNLGQLNLGRQPLRAMIIVGLVGLSTFLIVAVSAFRLSPTVRGTAGFDFVARTDLGVLVDLNQPQTRAALFSVGQVTAADNSETEPVDAAAAKTDARDTSALQVFGFRFHDGEHASCNNPFQAKQPQVIGVSQAFVDRFDDPAIPPFGWVASTANSPASRANPWKLLTQSPPPAANADANADANANADADADVIPVIIDKNTAWYSLKVYAPGSRFTIEFPDAGPVEFELVGLLDNSVLQGALLVGPEDFLRVFPNEVGSRYFLLNAPPPESETEMRRLATALKDYGWQAKPAAAELANYMAVQNTYLSAFQSLGSLGLLLGTIGLVVAQYRSMLERRREFAVFQAIGISGGRIQRLISRETLTLILLGFATGIGGAIVCVLPHWLSGSASVPFVGLSVTLLVILVIGMAASWLIGRLVMHGQLVGMLRSE